MAVDRRSELLPVAAPEEVSKVSPLTASVRYLEHLRSAWDHAHPDAPLSAQTLHPVDDEHTVTVQNNRDEDVTVYLDVAPYERSLGTVGAMSTATFELPERVVRGRETVDDLLRLEHDG